jgi:hypothetical protein
MFVYDFSSILHNVLVMFSWQMESTQNENILSIKNEMWMKWILIFFFVGTSKQNEISKQKE